MFRIWVLVALSVHSVQALRPSLVPEGSISWVQKNHSVLIRLETPDIALRIWNSEKNDFESTNDGSALVLNFTVSANSTELLLQDQPVLPLPNPNYPPRLSAYQIPAGTFSPYNALYEGGVKRQLLQLDYERFVENTRDDPSIHYYNWWPVLAINILGVGIGNEDITFLPSMAQKVIKIKLYDVNSIGQSSELYNAKWIIQDISFADRARDFQFRAPDELPQCTLWSWRCHDLSPGNDPPWYRYIYRYQFDEFGKIGSMRHHVLERWSVMYTNLGIWRLVLGAVFIFGLVLFPPLRAIWRRLSRTFNKQLMRYRTLRQEEEYWMEAEEEIEVGDYFRESSLTDHVFETRGRLSVDLPTFTVPAPKEESEDNPLPLLPIMLLDIEESEDEKA